VSANLHTSGLAPRQRTAGSSGTCAPYELGFEMGAARFQIHSGISLWMRGSANQPAVLLYRKSLFKQATISTFAQNLTTTLERLVSAPHTRIVD
jgi:hypothetical protein